MKATASFSIEQGLLIKFTEVVDEKKIDRNAVITTLIKGWVNDNTEVKMVICGKCSANYSGLLTECPQCRLKTLRESKKQQLKELEVRRVKMVKWVAEKKANQSELDIMNVEIEALKKDLGD